jgi:selenocysteine lyase/cysteine desulfurase
MPEDMRDEAAFARARRDYPATEDSVYLDVAARGILSRDVRTALDWILDDATLRGGQKQLWFERLEETRARFAKLINAEPDEIAFTKNVSEGLNIVAAGLPWAEGDNVVVALEAEHPNNVYPWLNLRRRGVALNGVPAVNGEIDTGRLISAIDGRTRLLSVASQTFSPGLRTDLDGLAEACARRGVFLLVDGAQSLGILDVDVKRTPLDALAVSTSKGLLGLYGMGFLYVRRDRAETMAPAYLARFGVDLDEAHEAEMGDAAYRLAPGARRFDLGNYNFPGAYAAHASLGRLLELGTKAIERHATRLARRLADGLAEQGLSVYGRGTAKLGSIVCAGTLGGGHDTTGDAAMAALYEHLAANRVRLSIRRGVLRFSFHLYNDDSDVDRVLALVKEWRR